jgi:hypothetical protein
MATLAKQTTLKNVMNKHIVITEPTSRLFSDMLGTLCFVKKASQSNTVYVKNDDFTKLLHVETTVNCFIVNRETHPEYFL